MRLLVAYRARAARASSESIATGSRTQAFCRWLMPASSTSASATQDLDATSVQSVSSTRLTSRLRVRSGGLAVRWAVTKGWMGRLSVPHSAQRVRCALEAGREHHQAIITKPRTQNEDPVGQPRPPRLCRIMRTMTLPWFRASIRVRVLHPGVLALQPRVTAPATVLKGRQGEATGGGAAFGREDEARWQ